MLLEEPVQNIRAKALGELFVQLDPGGDKILTSFKPFPLTDVFSPSVFFGNAVKQRSSNTYHICSVLRKDQLWSESQAALVICTPAS